MKEKIYLLLFTLLLIVGCVTSDNGKENRKIVGSADEIYIVEVEGHKYVIYDGCNQGGIIHAESCPCKERNENK